MFSDFDRHRQVESPIAGHRLAEVRNPESVGWNLQLVQTHPRTIYAQNVIAAPPLELGEPGPGGAAQVDN